MSEANVTPIGTGGAGGASTANVEFAEIRKMLSAISASAAFMQPSGRTPKLNAALAKAQGEFPDIPKTKKVDVVKEGRLLYSFFYADLADIIRLTRPALSKHGLSHSNNIQESPKGPRLTYFLKHESGEEVESSLAIGNATNGRPQDLGGVLTFYRRYLLSGLIGVASDDDTDSAGTSGGDEVTHGPRGAAAAKANGKGAKAAGPKPVDQTKTEGATAPTPPAKANGKPPATKPAKKGRSAEEAKRINEAMGSHGWKPEDGKAFIDAAYHVAGSADLTKDQFEEFIGVIESMTPEQALAVAKGDPA